MGEKIDSNASIQQLAEVGRLIPSILTGTYKFENVDDVNLNVAQAIERFVTTANENKHNRNSLNVGVANLVLLWTLKDTGGETRTWAIRAMENIIKTQTLGQIRKAGKITIGDYDINGDQLVNVLSNVSAVLIMGFDAAMALRNAAQNVFQLSTYNYLADIYGKARISLNSWKKAGSLVNKDFFGGKTKYTTRTGASGKIDQMMMQFGLVPEMSLENGQSKFKWNAFKSKYMFWMNNTTDYYTYATMMTAIMIENGAWEDYDLDANGVLMFTGNGRSKDKEFRNHRDKAHYNDPTLSEQEKYGLDWREQAALRATFGRVIGRYTRSERTALETEWIGKLFMMLRRYMPSMLSREFGVGQESAELGGYDENTGDWKGAYVEGRVWSLAKVIHGNYKMFVKKDRSTYDNLRPEQKRNAMWLMSDIGIAMALYAFYYGLFKMEDDEENKDKGFAEELVAKELRKLSMNYIGFTPSVWLDMLNKPFVAASFIGRMYDSTAKGDFDQIPRSLGPVRTGQTIYEAF